MVLPFARLTDHSCHPLDAASELEAKALVSAASLIIVDDAVGKRVCNTTCQVFGYPKQHHRVEHQNVDKPGVYADLVVHNPKVVKNGDRGHDQRDCH